MEVPAARPELPATVVMGARVILRIPMVQQEVMAGILEKQELVVLAVLPESVEPLAWLGSTAQSEQKRHPVVMGVTVEMGRLPQLQAKLAATAETAEMEVITVTVDLVVTVAMGQLGRLASRELIPETQAQQAASAVLVVTEVRAVLVERSQATEAVVGLRAKAVMEVLAELAWQVRTV
jgi:signal recognition particle GTPase